MLIYNLRRIFTLRGIHTPYRFLMDNGFASSSASNMLKIYPIVLKVKSLEKLCVALNCTPNDLFEWRDGKDAPLPADHALNALRKEAIKTFSELMKDLPLEKMGDVESFLENLKKEKSRPE